MSDLFGWFLLALRFSASNSGIKKTSGDVHWNVWNKVVRPKKYFQKKNYKYETLNHLYFGPSFVFWEIALRRFFCTFLSLVNHGGRHFSLPPPPLLSHPSAHKKASYSPGFYLQSKELLTFESYRCKHKQQNNRQ